MKNKAQTTAEVEALSANNAQHMPSSVANLEIHTVKQGMSRNEVVSH
jgi:hypothetical protein